MSAKATETGTTRRIIPSGPNFSSTKAEGYFGPLISNMVNILLRVLSPDETRLCSITHEMKPFGLIIYENRDKIEDRTDSVTWSSR